MGGVCRPEQGINGAALPPVCCGRLRAAGENQTQKRAGATPARFFSARKNAGRWRGEAERRLAEGVPKRRLCAAPKECPEAAAMAAGFNPFPGGRASGAPRGSGFLSGRPAAAGRDAQAAFGRRFLRVASACFPIRCEGGRSGGSRSLSSPLGRVSPTAGNPLER